MSSQKWAQRIALLEREVRKSIAGVIFFNLKVAQDLGLNGTDLQCLNLLGLQGFSRPGELAKWACLTTGGITVVLDRLEKAGYIKREPNPRDRRSSIIRPVPEAGRKLQAIYRSKGEALARILAGYSERELQLILGFFVKLNRSNM